MNFDNRHPVTPSLFTFHDVTKKIAHARKGHQLLKRKAEALKVHLRIVSSDLVITHDLVTKALKEAFMAMALAKFSNGDFGTFVMENISDQAQVKVETVPENIAGVQILKMTAKDGGVDKFGLVGLSTGGHQLNDAKKAFRESLKDIVRLATLRKSFTALDDAVKMITRKVNGLEKVIIPKLVNTLKYIEVEMDENEREEFYRLKKIKAKKQAKPSMKNISAKPQVVDFTSGTGDAHNFKTTGSQTVDHRVMALLYPAQPGPPSGLLESGDDVESGNFAHWDDEDILF